MSLSRIYSAARRVLNTFQRAIRFIHRIVARVVRFFRTYTDIRDTLHLFIAVLIATSVGLPVSAIVVGVILFPIVSALARWMADDIGTKVDNNPSPSITRKASFDTNVPCRACDTIISGERELGGALMGKRRNAALCDECYDTYTAMIERHEYVLRFMGTKNQLNDDD